MMVPSPNSCYTHTNDYSVVKPFPATSSTITFLYNWNMKTKYCLYESCLYTLSVYPSKFCKYPYQINSKTKIEIMNRKKEERESERQKQIQKQIQKQVDFLRLLPPITYI